MLLHKTHICVVKSLVKIAAVSWHSLRRFIKPAPDQFHRCDLDASSWNVFPYEVWASVIKKCPVFNVCIVLDVSAIDVFEYLVHK